MKALVTGTLQPIGTCPQCGYARFQGLTHHCPTQVSPLAVVIILEALNWIDGGAQDVPK